MAEGTRVIKLGREVKRERTENNCTLIGGLGLDWLNVKSLFRAHHAELAEALTAEARPGVLAFVLGPRAVEGRLWLAATDQLRSGSIGRHDRVDLYLPFEASLSLRHCVVLVRRIGDGVRISVVDLSSSAGLRDEAHALVHAVDADGHFFLIVPGGVLAFFPTGAPLPWDPKSPSPFATLAPREVLARSEEPRALWPTSAAGRGAVSSITARPGTVNHAAEPLFSPGQRHGGRLTLLAPGGVERFDVSIESLERGVVLGRYDRCAGARLFTDNSISRVHALLIRRDRVVHVVDAGSTNGVTVDGEEVRTVPVRSGATYELSADGAFTWDARP